MINWTAQPSFHLSPLRFPLILTMPLETLPNLYGRKTCHRFQLSLDGLTSLRGEHSENACMLRTFAQQQD